ncbi:inosine/guanosine kinase [Bacteriovorax stolpii]|uniref:Inosine/guanosine kinase n=1 Tax=Bacteriovorax stolpii TaxID=960 RepID=A0A2K9NTZ4_BACTC|nr:inosine/guanosine kinase [Bacteriovorax stolpii]AUN98214.1 inosine/guanosine kinase [Bacteriovorax stolpii]QDK41806.1 inosine/guanosine kinase [Bacteriovorax stolpii]TDP52133.1 inosine-guanosine kinase [Bacteriovorax stolpii]
MKFPGKRKTKHYFPVNESGRIPFDPDFSERSSVYVVGIDQLIVDIEANVSFEFLEKYKIQKGESVVFDDKIVEEIYRELKANKCIVGEYAGGAIGNTLHNYSVLSDSRSVALGAISKNISVGDYAFKYICTTNSFVDFSYLKPVDGPMGRALCLLTPDHERSFLIGKGIMNELSPDYVPEEVVKGAAALLVSAYSLRDENSSMFQANLKACQYAKESNVPVILSLGTSSLIAAKREFFLNFIREYVSVCAMNEEEAHALVNENDPLLACEKVLDYTDMVLLTVGPRGLYIAAYADEEYKRETKDMIHSKSIGEYNKYEYSRAILKKDCKHPFKIYTHINPYMGGPGVIKNTNGAGDAALSAVLHDIASNTYHRQVTPNSPKHNTRYLTYSSIHQVSKYCNRASFEVLKQNSPRLIKGLPNREESLEDAYWDL